MGELCFCVYLFGPCIKPGELSCGKCDYYCALELTMQGVLGVRPAFCLWREMYPVKYLALRNRHYCCLEYKTLEFENMYPDP